MNQVATVTELYLYPVKSMRGIAVEELDVYWYGFNGDRKHSFVRSGNPTGFPWLTGFYIEHNLWVLNYNDDICEKVFAGKNHVLAPAALNIGGGTARKDSGISHQPSNDIGH